MTSRTNTFTTGQHTHYSAKPAVRSSSHSINRLRSWVGNRMCRFMFATSRMREQDKASKSIRDAWAECKTRSPMVQLWRPAAVSPCACSCAQREIVKNESDCYGEARCVSTAGGANRGVSSVCEHVWIRGLAVAISLRTSMTENTARRLKYTDGWESLEALHTGHWRRWDRDDQSVSPTI